MEGLVTYIRDHAPNPSATRVVVSQSADARGGEEHIQEMRAVLSRYPDTFRSLEHVVAPVVSSSSDGATVVQHGSLRNAQGNLLRGLRRVFRDDEDDAPSQRDDAGGNGGGSSDIFRLRSAGSGASSSVSEALVLEDDAVLSEDALAYFTAAAEVLHGDRGGGADFATGYLLTRPSLLVGHADVDFMARWRGIDAREVAAAEAAAAAGDGEEAVEAGSNNSNGSNDSDGSTEDTHDSAPVIDRVLGTPRIVFKTYAWLLTRRGYDRLLPALTAMRDYIPPPLPLPLTGADADAGADKQAIVYRSGHPELSGCGWCMDWAYDHLIEWTLQGDVFLAPAIPRVTQRAGTAGATYKRSPSNAIWRGKPVAPADFQVHSLAMAVLRVFPSAGFSALAPRRPALPPAAAAEGQGMPLPLELDVSLSLGEWVWLLVREPVLLAVVVVAVAAGLPFFALAVRAVVRKIPLLKRKMHTTVVHVEHVEEGTLGTPPQSTSRGGTSSGTAESSSTGSGGANAPWAAVTVATASGLFGSPFGKGKAEKQH